MIRGGEIGLALPLGAFDREPGTTWVLAGPQLFALQNLVRERPGLPTLALRADLDLPLGGLGSDETTLSLKAIGTRSWGALRLHANASVSTGGGDAAGPRAERRVDGDPAPAQRIPMTAVTYPSGWTCEHVTVRLERYLLSTLPLGDALAIAEHIEACAWCGQALVLLRIDRRADPGRG